MSRNLIERLTEGVVNRDLQKEGAALLNKWEKTGLLEGLASEQQRAGMARLLENQAKQLLKESTSMAGGDVQGFSAVAFPLVRRVFAGLLAQDLVSVQPMSLPSGLIFFLDFTIGNEIGASGTQTSRLGYEASDSLYGGGRVASQITGGVLLTGEPLEDGPYSLNNGYSSATGSVTTGLTAIGSGTLGVTTQFGGKTLEQWTLFDPDLVSGSDQVYVASQAISSFTAFNRDNLVAITVSSSFGAGYFGSGIQQVRRLTQISGTSVVFVGVRAGGGGTVGTDITTMTSSLGYTFPITDAFANAATVGAVSTFGTWALENQASIPEIDIRVDSIAVTAVTKKLKAKWTPELGQDLNAYHNLDAEVELTSILSEQIALEIDREILQDLIKGATAGTYYWSRSPGLFVNRVTGVEVGASAAAPEFTGSVS